MSDPRGSDAPRSERKAYLRILSSLAAADGIADEQELERIHLAASELQVALSEHDLEPHDLDALAEGLSHAGLRARLLDELSALARTDDSLPEEELALIKFFAVSWDMTPPALEGVDWTTVGLPLPQDPDAGLDPEDEDEDEAEDEDDEEDEA